MLGYFISETSFLFGRSGSVIINREPITGLVVSDDILKNEALCLIQIGESEVVSYIHGDDNPRTIRAVVDRGQVYDNFGAAEQSRIQMLDIWIYGGDNQQGVTQVYESQDRFSIRIHKTINKTREYRVDKILSFNNFIWVLRLVG